MFEKYNELFEIYLRICKSKYNPEKPYDNLDKCCLACERFKWELSGMLSLLESIGEISSSKREEEFQKVLDTFSTHQLFNAYIQDGEVMVWA